MLKILKKSCKIIKELSRNNKIIHEYRNNYRYSLAYRNQICYNKCIIYMTSKIGRGLRPRSGGFAPKPPLSIRGRGLCPLNPHKGLCPQTPAGGDLKMGTPHAPPRTPHDYSHRGNTSAPMIVYCLILGVKGGYTPLAGGVGGSAPHKTASPTGQSPPQGSIPKNSKAVSQYFRTIKG